MDPTLAGPSPAETETLKPNFETDLKEAQAGFYDLTFEDEFEEFSKGSGLTMDDTDKPEYWALVANYAHDKTFDAHDQKERGSIAELIAATPDFIYTQASLERGRQGFAKSEVYNDARSRASYYNNLLRQVASRYPDAKASQLRAALENTANISIEDRNIKNFSVNTINSTIRGAQHEIAFGQLLARTGRDFREAEPEEDLRGVDYVAAGRRGRKLYLDVKASLHEVGKKGSEVAYAIDPVDGNITIYSLLTKEDLGDSFYVSEAIADRKGEALKIMLQDLEMLELRAAVGGVGMKAIR